MKTMISSLSPTSCAAQPRPAEPPQKSSLEAEPRIRTPTSTQDPPPGAPDRPVQRAPTGLAWLRSSPPPGSGGDRGGGDRRAAARRRLGGWAAAMTSLKPRRLACGPALSRGGLEWFWLAVGRREALAPAWVAERPAEFSLGLGVGGAAGSRRSWWSGAASIRRPSAFQGVYLSPNHRYRGG